MTEKLKNPFKINELVTAVNSLVDEKQDLISDLSTIRSGAALGATALQSITSSNVTTALGYTPYDSTNPNGYITNSALTPYVSSVNNVSPVNGNVTLSIPAAQVNSDWNATSGVAQILNKPTVNNASLIIQKNGTNVATFTANASSNVTANISVPTNTNELTNGAGFITSSALTGYEQTSNKVTSISSSSTNTQYPSAKCVYDIVGDIETALHTINSGS